MAKKGRAKKKTPGMDRTQVFLLLAKSAVAVALLKLSFPAVALWPLAILSTSYVAYVLLQLKDPKQGALFFGSYAFFCNLIGFYWICYTIHEFAELSWFIAVPLGVGLFGALSIFSALAGAAWAKYLNRPGVLGLGLLFVFLYLWDVMDTRMFPWAPMMGLGGSPRILASLSFFDSWGMRALYLLAAMGILYAWQNRHSKRAAMGATLALVSVAVPWFVGGYQRDKLKRHYSERQPVAILQGNIGNYQKRQSKNAVMPTVRNVLGIYRDLIEEVSIYFAPLTQTDSTGTPGVEPWLVWPETAFPGFPLRQRQMQEQLDYWSQLSRGLHLLGAYEDGKITFHGAQKNAEYNIALMIHESEGYVAHYRKRILMPFGEYFPGDAYLSKVYHWFPQVNHFGRGLEFRPLPHPDPEGPVFLPLICYEVLHNDLVDEYKESIKAKYPGRDIVLYNPTNDSWYGRSVQPFMHARLSQWQTARVGLSMIRATNTGVSMLIAPWGEILNSGPIFAKRAVYGELPVHRLQRRIVD